MGFLRKQQFGYEIKKAGSIQVSYIANEAFFGHWRFII